MGFKEIFFKDRTVGYDPDTGNVSGIKTHLDSKGYIIFWIGRRSTRVHRFAYLVITGKLPEHFIDHKDHNRANNKWSNLRPVNDSQNKLNTRLYITNTSGYVGVKRKNNGWSWQINIDHKRHFKQTFNCPTSAALSRDKFILKLGNEYAKLNLLERKS